MNNPYGRYPSNQDNGDTQMIQAVQALRAEFDQKLNRYAGGLRQMMDAKQAELDNKLKQLSAIAQALSITRSGGGGLGQSQEGNVVKHGITGPVRISDIPGKRVPYTLLLEIPFEADDITPRQAIFTNTQEGPFVAVSRMATFLSNYEFSTTDPDSGEKADFLGRSYGRFRPISSENDLLDSQQNAMSDSADWYWNMLQNPGVVAGQRMPSGTLSLPSSMSSFRTMQFDGRIEVSISGSDYPRQNRSVPSSFWRRSFGSPWDQAALDFIERGEAFVVKVEPMHINNPPYGNVTGAHVFPLTGDGLTGWPFTDGQFDPHEGIATPGASTWDSTTPDLVNLLQADAVTRIPRGILILGWEGYRIGQPIGVAP